MSSHWQSSYSIVSFQTFVAEACESRWFTGNGSSTSSVVVSRESCELVDEWWFWGVKYEIIVVSDSVWKGLVNQCNPCFMQSFISFIVNVGLSTRRTMLLCVLIVTVVWYVSFSCNYVITLTLKFWSVYLICKCTRPVAYVPSQLLQLWHNCYCSMVCESFAVKTLTLKFRSKYI